MCLLFTGSAELVIPGNVVHADNLVMHSGPRGCAQIHCIHTGTYFTHNSIMWPFKDSFKWPIATNTNMIFAYYIIIPLFNGGINLVANY